VEAERCGQFHVSQLMMVAAHRSPTYQPLLEKRAASRKRASATVDNVPWPATSSRMRRTNVRGVG
jgi:hypothetical protein